MIAPTFAPLQLGSDLALRHRYFLPESFAHPAKLHLGFLSFLLERYTKPGDTIADPMAGIGSICFAATLARNVIAREIEPRWLEIARENAASIQEQAGLFAGTIDIDQADAREAWNYRADHIIFSPPYGNEASSSPNGHRFLPYKLVDPTIPYDKRWQKLIESQSPGAMGAVSFHYGTHPAQIGHYRHARYWQAMTEIYSNCYESLSAGGYLILITKDHIAAGSRVWTGEQTIALCERLGFVLVARHQRQVFPLALWQRRRKEAGKPIVEEEDALVFCRRESENLA